MLVNPCWCLSCRLNAKAITVALRGIRMLPYGFASGLNGLNNLASNDVSVVKIVTVAFYLLSGCQPNGIYHVPGSTSTTGT